ncbi:hypothetical protein LCGC14_3109680, partial [marine sediment metagenome]
TLSTAAQPNITSLGTLTILQVDNIRINGNTIDSTAGTDLNITPLAGQQIVLDGTIIIDAGVVTGATSITSTSLVGALTGNATTATALETARTIGGTSFDGTANIVPGTITVADTTDATAFVALWESATGDLAPKSDLGLTYNASTAALTATTFSGALSGNATTATALATARTIGGVSFDGSANIVPTTIAVTDTVDTTCFVGLWESATGDLLPQTDLGLTYNAGTAVLTTTTFSGALSGNASTATILATARDINGVSFDGSANITVTAAAGTLTGTTLKSTVVTSSLTTVGTLGSGAISSGFGNIDNGSSTLDTGALTATTVTFTGLMTLSSNLWLGNSGQLN